MFASTENKGFQMTFANGYTISCQFGATNYCANYPRKFAPDYRYKEEMTKPVHTCVDCEVAIWKSGDGNFITSKIVEAIGMCADDDVLCGVSPDEVAKIISYLVTL